VSGSWKCPDCEGWVAYWVAVHHCKPTAIDSKTDPGRKGPDAAPEGPAGQAKGADENPPGYSAHMGGSFDRQARHDYEPAPRWGFRP
jgi:hypothetical protein